MSSSLERPRLAGDDNLEGDGDVEEFDTAPPIRESDIARSIMSKDWFGLLGVLTFPPLPTIVFPALCGASEPEPVEAMALEPQGRTAVLPWGGMGPWGWC